MNLSRPKFGESTTWACKRNFFFFYLRKPFNLLKADPIKQLNRRVTQRDNDNSVTLLEEDSVCNRSWQVEGEKMNQVDFVFREGELTWPLLEIIPLSTHSWSGWPHVIRVCPLGLMASFLILHLCSLIMGHASARDIWGGWWLGIHVGL